MKFRYAQMRVRQLKKSLQPTQSSDVIDWPVAEQKAKAEDGLPFKKASAFKQVPAGRS